MAFTSRMVVYIGFIAFAIIFYRNIDEMPVAARTMPLMAIIAVIFLSAALLLSDIVRVVRTRSTSAAVEPLATSDEAAKASEPVVVEEEDLDLEDDPAAQIAAEVDARSDPTEALKPQMEMGGDDLDVSRVLRYALPSAILVAIYIYVLPTVGFVPASIVFMGALAFILGARSTWKIAIYAVFFPFAFQYLFEQLLQLRLP